MLLCLSDYLRDFVTIEWMMNQKNLNKYLRSCPHFINCQYTKSAVVRDGIEIDSCDSIGGLEFGEIVEAYDRCINSSGVMRYRTRRGWVSKQTRGHG